MRKTIALAAAVAAAHLLAPASHAQTAAWKPEKPVEIVVPAAAGGGTDRTARTIQRIFQDRGLVETPALVVNKPGAQGGIGFMYGAQHRGDAHYIVTTYPSLLTNHIIGRSTLNHTNLTPLAQFGNEYIGFAVKSDSQIGSTRDLLDRLRKDPGSVVFATFALGAPTHIAVALVAKAAGVDARRLKVVVVSSGADAMTALLGGHVDMVPSAIGNLLPQMQDGRIRAVAVTSPKRGSGVFAQVPTWKESGIDVVTGYWRGVVGPPGLSAPQIGYWDNVFARLVATDEWKQELDRNATENDYINSRASRQFLDSQYDELKRILVDLGLAKQN